LKNHEKLFLLFVALTTFGALSAQGNGSGFEIDARCQCLTFVSHCHGDLVNVNGYISYTCTDSNGQTDIFEYPVDTGVACFRPNTLSGCLENIEICLEDDGLIEICEIRDCEVVVYRTLENNPTINGQLIGIFNGIPSSASVACQGPTVDVLNTKESAMDLLACPGDQLILDNIYEFNNKGDGDCLRISLYDEGGFLVAQESRLSSGNFLGGGFDMASLFDGLELGLYQIEFKLVCCNTNDTNCGPNDTKTAWIDLQGEFSYGMIGATGFFPLTTTFEPSSEPNGTTYSNVSGDFFTMSLHSIQNSSNTNVEVSLTSTLCDDNPDNDINFGTQIFPPTLNNITIPFANFNQDDCTCFQLDVSYDDGCEVGVTTDSWFYQSDPECEDNFGTPDDPIFRKSFQGSPNSEIKLIQNPVQDKIVFNIGNTRLEESYSIEVFDLSGRSIMNQDGIFGSRSLELPFQAISGIYFYTMQVGHNLYSGKIIKP